MKNPSGSSFASPDPKLERRIRRRKKPVQGRSQATVEAIYDAALQVLTKGGMAGLTTTAIAARAGVSVGTLYQYFPDKESVLTALWVRFVSCAKAAVAEAHDVVRGKPPEVALELLVEGLIDFKRDNLELILALREPMATFQGEAYVRTRVEAMVALVSSVVKDPYRARVLTAALDGVLMSTIDHEPELLRTAKFRAELTRLALGYAHGPRTRQRSTVRADARTHA